MQSQARNIVLIFAAEAESSHTVMVLCDLASWLVKSGLEYLLYNETVDTASVEI